MDLTYTANSSTSVELYHSDSVMTENELPPAPETLAKQLKVLADPKRLRILNLLMSGVQCNCEIGDALNMPANLISHHLRVLRKAGLVEVERDALDARWVYYSVNEEAIRALVAAFDAFFDLGRIQPRHPTCGPKRMKGKPPKKLIVKPL